MVDSLLLQDYVTISGYTFLDENVVITQGASGWLDISRYEDVVLFVDMKSAAVNAVATTAIQMAFQTAPAPEEASFVTMFNQAQSSFSLGVTVPLGISVWPFLAVCTNVPPANLLRWQIGAQGNNELNQLVNVTFRIWVSAYSLTC
jgi:hypothetical protein